MDEAARRLAAQNEARRRKRKSRGRGLRRTTGCLTCKRRHLRCDEVTPECRNCVKSRQTCLYAAPPPPSPAENSNGNHRSPNPEPEPSRVPSLDLTVETYHPPELISPSLSIAAAAAASYRPASIPPDTAFYGWFGLLADDAAAAADEDTDALPRFQELTNGLSLEELRERYSIQNGAVSCSSEPSTSQDIVRGSWHGSRPTELSPSEVALFDNFVNQVSLWIDLYDPSRCFSVLVPHLAMRDAGLMNAILALSSRQLSISPRANEFERDRRIGLQYYHDTLRYLHQAMSVDAYTTSVELLATVLIVSMYEMLDDSGNGWERHLKDVFWIQRSQLIHGETGGLGSAVWWAWLRQDVWAAFRERRKTLSFWKPTKAYTMLSSSEKAARIVWIFAKAVDYCSKDAVAEGQEDIKARLERADTIFEMLKEWEDNLPVEFTPLPTVPKLGPSDCFEPLWIHPPAFGISMQLFRSAQILILLHKPSLGGIRGYAEQQRLMEAAASIVCRIAMTLTDAASSLMSSQCLYIAGLSIQNPQQRENVVRLIDGCHSKTGWPRASLSGDLKQDWAKLDSS
ncbi:hypothetical protein K449DRAFT_415252 [Hypoxylon sp. EC38]|nr:hypothetical protein K449DRAFT_415252 [Hypoxylon sp. EC38]